MGPKALIFDLDGTLWDTCVACAEGWNMAVEEMGLSYRTISADEIRAVAGKPHIDCVREIFFDLSEKEILILNELTSKWDNKILSLKGGSLYDGVFEGIKELSTYFPLYIVSNCQDGYIECFLETSGLEEYFLDFESWGRTQNSKDKNIIDIISRNNLVDPIYIGDTLGDKKAASLAKVPFIYVDYGFGKLDESLSFKSFCELKNYLLNTSVLSDIS